MKRAWAMAAVVMLGCGGCRSSEGTAGGPSGDVPPAQDTQDCQTVDGGVSVSLSTSDGVELEADFYPSGKAGGPAVVLLHMIPPNNDKSNYPREFIAALTSAGFTVLNVNRRGAGNSGGQAKDAYEGDAGRLDAVAAQQFLTGSGCTVPTGRIGWVGASNGTTTALDFTVSTPAEQQPFALVFLSPGGYTENQNTVSSHASRLSGIPLLVAYPDSEAAWPESIRSAAGDAWTFREYDGGRHGTGLFSTHPDITDTIAEFLQTSLPSG